MGEVVVVVRPLGSWGRAENFHGVDGVVSGENVGFEGEDHGESDVDHEASEAEVVGDADVPDSEERGEGEFADEEAVDPSEQHGEQVDV